MAKPRKNQDMEATKRIMERLVNMPHKPHKPPRPENPKERKREKKDKTRYQRGL
jgi:hypothetical protein